LGHGEGGKDLLQILALTGGTGRLFGTEHQGLEFATTLLALILE
jgi:hypothetical protein